MGNSPQHTYQPGLLFIPFQKSGYRTLADIQKPTADFIAAGVDYLCEKILAIDTEQRQVTTEGRNPDAGRGCGPVMPLERKMH